MALWITLPHSWRLQDVQAALNVIITVLSGLGIFVLTRCCWLLAARTAARAKTVASSTLLTLNTLGEVLDTSLLLNARMVLHGRIIIQAVVVVALSLMALLSGLIARYSTQTAEAVIFSPTEGLLASRSDNSMADSQVAWNTTITSLDHANFPVNQLLDYMPDAANAWIYQPEEWNNSWTMDCSLTEKTPVELTLTDNCTTFTAKFGEAVRREVFPKGFYSEEYTYSFADYYLNSTFIQDLLVSLFAANYSDYDEPSDTYRTIDMAYGTLHVHGLQKNDSTFSNTCRFGEGSVSSTSYTRVDCVVSHANTLVQSVGTAYPDCEDVSGIPSSLVAHFFKRFKRESMTESAISAITPRDLIRFYQAYMITKDTQRIRPVHRFMSVKVPAVQVASLFVAVAALLVLFIGLGGFAYGLFLLWYRDTANKVPQSKLDWLLHSASVSPSTGASAYASDHTAMPMTRQDRIQRRDLRRAQFEAATYSNGSRCPFAQPAAQIMYASPPKGT